MLDKAVLAQVSDAFAALDFSDETERLAALNATLAEISGADTKARERIGELDRLIRDYKGASGNDVAAALIGGSDVTVAAQVGTSLATLQDERDRLFPALKALRDKNEDTLAEMREVRSVIATRIRDAVEPLTDAIMAEAGAAIERLTACFASLGAIAAMGEGGYGRKDRIAKVIKAANAAGDLTRYARSYPVPAEIFAALSPLEGKPGLRGARVPQSILAP